MDSARLPISRLHELARARAHELREEALDAAWRRLASACLRVWHAVVRVRSPQGAVLEP